MCQGAGEGFSGWEPVLVPLIRDAHCHGDGLPIYVDSDWKDPIQLRKNQTRYNAELLDVGRQFVFRHHSTFGRSRRKVQNIPHRPVSRPRMIAKPIQR
jgi:hypothetical protein